MRAELATREDIERLRRDLVEREVKSIHWFIGVFASIQIAYFAITLGAVYFLMNQVIAHLPK